MISNAHLRAAKRVRNDEFYTRYEDIEDEVAAYIEYDPSVFTGKTILLPCDDWEWSNFTKYFLEHFNEYGIKKLISTCFTKNGNGKIFTHDEQGQTIGLLNGDGDFRSDEVTRLRDEADVIITNPPFSMFGDFIRWIGEKQFLVIGNKNALTYKEVFPLIKDDKIWLGRSRRTHFVFDTANDGIKDVSALWFTNLDYGHQCQPLKLMTMAENLKYSKHARVRENAYKQYDNYEAIEVPFTDTIPSDYDGAMGVPISWYCKYDPSQFEILDKLINPILGGKPIYKRLIIRRRDANNQQTDTQAKE